MKKKVLITITCLICAILFWNHLPYYYSNDRTTDYITKNVAPKSRTMCAGYVIRAMWRGGCPIGLLPAYAYNKTLPQMGFKEISVKCYKPMKGDISVLPSNKHSPFGHIAVYNGNKWISDFEQLSIFPGKAYREVGKYQIFRATDGWHWKHVWTTPVDWYGWVQAAIKGRNSIRL